MNRWNCFVLIFVLSISVFHGCAATMGVGVLPGGAEYFMDPGQLTSTAGLVSAPGGEMLVSDISRGVIYSLSDGKLLPFIEGLVTPDDITFGPGGDLFITEIEVGRIRRVDSRGILRTLQELLIAPNGIVVGPDGSLFVSEFYSGLILKLDPKTGKEIIKHRCKLRTPNGMAFGPDGRLYVSGSSDGRIACIDPVSLTEEVLPLSFNGPTAIKFGLGGRLYLTEYLSGHLVEVEHFDELNRASRSEIANLEPGLDNLWVGGTGEIIISNSLTGSLYKVDPGLERWKYLKRGGLATPGSILFDPSNGRVIIGGNQIATFDLDGRPLGYLALPMVFAEGDRQLMGATDFCLTPEGSLLVTKKVSGHLPGGPRDGVILKIEPNGGTEVFFDDLVTPAGIVQAEDGTILVAETWAGRVSRIAEGKRMPVSEVLERPIDIEISSAGLPVVVDQKAGQVVELHTREKHVLIEGLNSPSGIKRLPGTEEYLVVEAGRGRLLRFDREGNRTTLLRLAPEDFIPPSPLTYQVINGIEVVGNRVLVSLAGRNAVLSLLLP